MSGHNKWSSIKHKKGANDAKRGKLFSKLIKEITVATKIGGDIIEGNPRLKTAIDKAKQANMPSKNIDSAIKRGAGNMEGVDYQEIVYEGYAPGGVALMIKCLTDNKNRSVSDVRSTLTKNNGSLGENGSVAWQFDQKGVISIEASESPGEEAMMELALEAGAEDVINEEEGVTVLTDPSDFNTILDKIKEQGIAVAEADITFYPRQTVPVSSEDAEKINRLVELLDDLDDVQFVSSNEELKS